MLKRLHTLHTTGPGILPSSITSIFSAKFSYPMLRSALCARYDCLTSHTPCCLCTGSQLDSAVHALGGCTHPTTHSMICSRHGAEVHACTTCVRASITCLAFEDAEGHERTPVLPDYIFPTPQLPALALSKPDLVVMTGLPPHAVPTAHKATSKVTFHILE